MNEYNDPIVCAIKASVSVPVDVECDGFPDVIFNVIFDSRPDSSMVEQIVSALENYMFSYNKKHIFRPIHYVSDSDSLPECSYDFSVCIHMDCGNASPRSLIGAVKSIADTNLPIYRIVLE